MKRLIALLLLLAVPALAGNGVSGVTVSTYRNLTSVAVEAWVSGDDDSSAVLRIFQRIRGSGNSYDTGMVMVRRLGFNAHEGRILRMSPGQTVDYFVRASDALGDMDTRQDTVSCARVRPNVATGAIRFVDGINGSDANDGTTQALAEKTIGAAIADLKASTDSGGNGGIFVLPGEYHERVDLDWGIDGKTRFLVGLGNRDTIIICGASIIVEQGNASVGNALSWSARPAETGKADSIYKTFFPAGDSTQLVVVGWGELLHRKTSLLALGRDSTGVSQAGAENQGEISGWWWKSDTLFVKRRSGASPAGITLHTGYRDFMVHVKAPNWRVSNLTIRFAGAMTGQTGLDSDAWTSREDPGMRGYGILWGNQGHPSNVVADSLKIIGCNISAIWAGTGAGNPDSCTITNCYIDGLTVGGMYYGAAKGRAEENAGEIILKWQGTSFNNNFITGTHQGIEPGTSPTDSIGGRFVEIVGNYCTNMSDDGIEPDVSAGINMLIMNNTVRNTSSAISFDPVYKGPLFVFYNTLLQSSDAGVKTGAALGSSVGIVKFYQNTVASNVGQRLGAVGGGNRAVNGNGGVVANIEFRNNILLGANETGTIAGDASFSTTLNSFNYNLIDSINTTNLANFNSTAYSLATLRSSLGWEANGTVGSIAFADSSGGRWSIHPTNSRAAKMGMRITGVNTDLTGKYIGGGRQPTVGAQPCFPVPCWDFTP